MRWTYALVVALAAWALFDVVIGRIPGWPEFCSFSGAFAALVWAAVDLRSQGFVPALIRPKRMASSQIALTFDDGPDVQTTPWVLEVLRRYNARGTFFLVGEKAEALPALVQQLIAEGHEVASHGYRHRWQDFVSPVSARHSLRESVRVIGSASQRPVRYFRPPYGVSVPAMHGAVRDAGLRVVGWSIRTRDGTGRGNAQARAQKIAAAVKSGDIVLLHDAPERVGGRLPLGPQMLEPLLQGVAQQGMACVTLSTLLQGGE